MEEQLLFNDTYSKASIIVLLILIALKGLLSVIYFRSETKVSIISPKFLTFDVAKEKEKYKLLINILIGLQYFIVFILLVINWNKI